MVLGISEKKSMRYEKSLGRKSKQLYHDPKHFHREHRAPCKGREKKSVCEKRENARKILKGQSRGQKGR